MRTEETVDTSVFVDGFFSPYMYILTYVSFKRVVAVQYDGTNR